MDLILEGNNSECLNEEDIANYEKVLSNSNDNEVAEIQHLEYYEDDYLELEDILKRWGLSNILPTFLGN